MAELKEEVDAMRSDDYDVTDLLAGLVKIEESEGEEESEIAFDEESYFEEVPTDKNVLEINID